MKYIKIDNKVFEVRKIELDKIYTYNGGIYDLDKVEEMFRISDRFYTLEDLRKLHNKVVMILQHKLEENKDE